MNLAGFSNTGSQMDIVAPGVNIQSVHLNNQPVIVNGTSASVQHVAGVAALIWSKRKELSNKQLEALLLKNTTPLAVSLKILYQVT